jgi:hypothetical protein
VMTKNSIMHRYAGIVWDAYVGGRDAGSKANPVLPKSDGCLFGWTIWSRHRRASLRGSRFDDARRMFAIGYAESTAMQPEREPL